MHGKENLAKVCCFEIVLALDTDFIFFRSMSTAAPLVDPARYNDSGQTTRKRHFQIKTVCGTGHCPHRQVDWGKIRTQPDSKRSWAKNTGSWSSIKMLP